MPLPVSWLCLVPLLGSAGAPLERDCNGNGVEDAADIAEGHSVDENWNGIPDECEEPAPPCARVGRALCVHPRKTPS